MTQEKKQTAVDWLSEQTYNVFNELQRGNITMADFRFKMLNFEQQAIAMEREQIKEAYIDSEARYHSMNDAKAMAKHYYEQNYGKEEGS